MAEKIIFSKVVTVRNGYDVKIAKMVTVRKRDLKSFYWKAYINDCHFGIFETRQDMANFMVNKFYCGGD